MLPAYSFEDLMNPSVKWQPSSGLEPAWGPETWAHPTCLAASFMLLLLYVLSVACICPSMRNATLATGPWATYALTFCLQLLFKGTSPSKGTLAIYIHPRPDYLLLACPQPSYFLPACISDCGENTGIVPNDPWL